VIVLRALAGFWGIHGCWGALKYMPLNLANCLLMTGPIPIAIAARFILKESMTKYDIASMFMSLAGIFVINNPFAEELDPTKAHNYWIGTMYALSALLANSIICLAMRHMRDGIHYTISPFWFSSGCTFISPLMQAYTLNQPQIENGEIVSSQ
jgi:drug/metabolite transporter (DMT)-like permease